MEKEVMENDMKKHTDTPPARRALKDGGLKAVISVLAVVILLITAFGAVYGVYGWAFITTQPVKEYKAEMYAKVSKDAPKGGVVFLGDSLTEMYDLSEHYPDLKVYNRGISGDTTDHMLERLESNVIALSPDVVVFLGGCNDIRHGVPISDVIENISQILGALKIRLPDTPVIVQSLYPINTNSSGIFKNTPGQATAEKLQDANEQIAALCEQNGVTFVDMFSVFADDSGNIKLEYVLPDGLHLKPASYNLVTAKLTPLIKDALRA